MALVFKDMRLSHSHYRCCHCLATDFCKMARKKGRGRCRAAREQPRRRPGRADLIRFSVLTFGAGSAE